METISRITTDIDFEREGKQVSVLHVPNSVNDSAYGTVLVPITVVQNGRGPNLLATGGVHGDEYEGPIILAKLARMLEPAQVQGRIIIVPALNLPALMAGTRLSPIDDKNLNRIFPGERDGTITSTIAHFVDSVLFPLCDIVIDLHSGGYSLDYIPTVFMHHLEDRERRETTLEALKVFGAPIGLISRDLDATGLLDYRAEAHRKITITTELGGAGTVSRDAVRIGETGVWNLLRHFKFVEGDIVTPEAEGRLPTRVMETPDLDCFVMATEEGVYEPFSNLGETIEAGQPIGQIHRLHLPDHEPVVITARRTGLLICRRAPGQTRSGDCVAITVSDFVEATG